MIQTLAGTTNSPRVYREPARAGSPGGLRRVYYQQSRRLRPERGRRTGRSTSAGRATHPRLTNRGLGPGASRGATRHQARLIVDALQARGFRLVTVTQLFELQGRQLIPGAVYRCGN